MKSVTESTLIQKMAILNNKKKLLLDLSAPFSSLQAYSQKFFFDH